MIATLLWTAGAFLCGSLPLSVWLGRIALHTDIRRYGDGNPGGTNVLRAGGRWWGALAMFLDGMKALVPVALARYAAGVDGWPLVPVALAPVAGHAWSPFLRLRGGKAIAVTFGTWTALTLYLGPTVLGLAVAFWIAVQRVEAWAVLAGMLTLLAALLLTGSGPHLLAVWGGNLAILLWKHRGALRQPPRWSEGLPGRWIK